MPQVSIMHSKLSKQSSSVLQPPCKIPHGSSGVQQVELYSDLLVGVQFGLYLKVHGAPTFLWTALDSIETKSKREVI